MDTQEAIRHLVRRMLPLLEKEREAEMEETRASVREMRPEELQARGRCLLRLRIGEESLGMGGRTHWQLVLTRGGDLPAHRLQPGDAVELRSMKTHSPPVAGVLTRVWSSGVRMTVESEPDEKLLEPYRLDRAPSDTTHRRLKEAVLSLEGEGERRNPLLAVAFGARLPGFVPEKEPPAVAEALNPAQCKALRMALRSDDLCLIHGPPGTGKTTTLVEICVRLVARGERILVTAPSNIAVDHLTEKLAAREVPLVRVGHPARLLPQVAAYSLDAQVEASDARRYGNDARRELETTRRRLERARGREARDPLMQRQRELRKELRDRERQAVQEVLGGARIVLATAVGCADALLRGQLFDRVILDEAAQSLEAASWIPLLRAPRALLAGDHLQLPPTILSREAERGGLSVTLFERLHALVGAEAGCRLEVQYRMHAAIMRFPSEQLYDGCLQADTSVAAHRLCDLPGVRATDRTKAPLWFIDTAGCDLDEVQGGGDGLSRSNPGEARLVVAHVEALLEAGVPAEGIAVISPYHAQVQALRAALPDTGLEIDSVDGFQGREKEAVIVSLVRSNREGEIGFLRDDRRTNVAFTRARRHLTVIGDSSTLAQHPFLASWIAHCQEGDAYHSAWEFADLSS